MPCGLLRRHTARQGRTAGPHEGWTPRPVAPYLDAMLVQCPACSAAYEVPDHLLKGGPRLLQCAKCRHSFQAPALPQAPLAEPPPPAPEAIAPLAEPPAPKPPAAAKPAEAPPATPPDRPALLGWAATAGVLVLAAGLLSTYRAEVIQAWPPAARLFQWLGMG